MAAIGLSIGFVLWCAAIGWVATDAARRHRSWFGWALLVGTTNIFGLALWLIARRRIPVVDVRLTPLKRVLLWLAPVPVLIVSSVLALQVGTLLSLMQVARVEGVAMAPTINNQDRLIVNKLAYLVHPPQRGDIVMHRYPRDPAKTFVKRVIAMGGDTVRSVEGRVFVNDAPLNEGYVASEYRSHDSWGPWTLPEGQYFVMGDHRNNSSDSRTWGLVSADLMLGRIAARWWPIGDVKAF